MFHFSYTYHSLVPLSFTSLSLVGHLVSEVSSECFITDLSGLGGLLSQSTCQFFNQTLTSSCYGIQNPSHHPYFILCKMMCWKLFWIKSQVVSVEVSPTNWLLCRFVCAIAHNIVDMLYHLCSFYCCVAPANLIYMPNFYEWPYKVLVFPLPNVGGGVGYHWDIR